MPASVTDPAAHPPDRELLRVVTAAQRALLDAGPSPAVSERLLRDLLRVTGSTRVILVKVATAPNGGMQLRAVQEIDPDPPSGAALRDLAEFEFDLEQASCEPGDEVAWSWLHAGGRKIGLLGLGGRPGGYTAELVECIKPLSHVCGLLLDALRVQGEMRAGERRRAAVLEAALDCVVVADHEGRVVEFSPAAERTFGWSREEAAGRLLGELFIPPEMRAAHEAGMERFLSTGVSRVLGKRIELEAVRADGRRMPVELAIQVTHQDGVPFFTAYVRDITARQEAEQELRMAKDAAEEASRAKSRFLASVSHEIRTPMTAILGYADMIAKGRLDEEQLARLRRLVKQNASHLLSLVDDLLDVSRIEAGRLPLVPTLVDVGQLVDDVADLFSAHAAERLLELRVVRTTELPAVVRIDGTRLRQILVNLVSNALKFTHTGYVEMRAAARYAGSEPGRVMLQVEVEDTGDGIPASQQELLFEPFVQLPGTYVGTGGSGLGLAIVRLLARLMGGDVRLQSDVGRGSVFTVEFAAEAVADAEPVEPLLGAGDSELSSPPRLDGLDILVVDDNADNRAIVRFLLEDLGASCRLAHDGVEAVELLRAARQEQALPDLVLMDLQMPRMDGFEALAALRAEGFELPVVALTAFAMVDDRARVEQAGFDEYASKPVRIGELARSIVRLLPDAGRRETTRMDTAPLHSSRVDDPRFLPLLRNYLASVEEQVRSIEMAITAGDRNGLAVLVHQVKGSGGGYGFAELTVRAGECEEPLRAGSAMADVAPLLDALLVAMRRAIAGGEDLPEE